MTAHPTISIIAAVAADGAIGRGGDLPFHLSGDLRHFKAVTMGKPVIMGRKTFESLPGGALPGRRNIVITRNPEYQASGAECVTSLEAAIAATANAEEIMIIGGGEIYRQAMPSAHRLFLTHVNTEVPDADTFFPSITPDEWVETDRSEPITDQRSGINYEFITLSRI